MPCTPWRSTSSATRNASTIEVPLSSTDSRRLFGITISVSTCLASSVTPSSACRARRVPSKPNGFVTMPTVERADLLRDARDDRRRAGARAAAGAGGDEHHVGALEQRLDAIVVRDRGRAADGGVRAGAEPARDVGADVQRHVGGALLERLEVGVDRR